MREDSRRDDGEGGGGRLSSLIPHLSSLFLRTPVGRQAAWNLVSLVVLTGLTQVAALGTVLLVNRSLGPEGFGVFAFGCSLQPWLYTVSTLGAPLVLFREGTNHPEQLDQITTASWCIGLA